MLVPPAWAPMEQVAPRDPCGGCRGELGAACALVAVCAHEHASCRTGVSVPEERLHPAVQMPLQVCPEARVRTHTRYPLVSDVTVLQQTCAWARTWQRTAVCVCMRVWHVCRHGHGVHAGTGSCARLGPRVEGWHSWDATWDPGQWGNACVLLCHAEPLVPPDTPDACGTAGAPNAPSAPCIQAHSENMGQAVSRSALCRARWKVTLSSS